MNATKTARSAPSKRREAQNLEVRYGQIGISAVAAAMRYQGDLKTKRETNAKTDAKTDAKAAAPASANRQSDQRLKDMFAGFAA
jgi:hypothetical protein